MDDDSYAVCDLSDDPKPKKQEKQPSFWEGKMEGIPKEAFKKGAMKATTSKNDAKAPQKAKEQEKKVQTDQDRKRQGLIRLYNSYLTSSFHEKLQLAGFHCQVLPQNASSETAEFYLDQINEILSSHQSTRMATKLMQGVNKATEFIYPELKFGEDSLSNIFNLAVETPGSQMNQNMEELGLHMRPYIPSSFWVRFLADYVCFVEELINLKKRGIPVNKGQNATKEYNAFEDLNAKFEACEL